MALTNKAPALNPASNPGVLATQVTQGLQLSPATWEKASGSAQCITLEFLKGFRCPMHHPTSSSSQGGIEPNTSQNQLFSLPQCCLEVSLGEPMLRDEEPKLLPPGKGAQQAPCRPRDRASPAQGRMLARPYLLRGDIEALTSDTNTQQAKSEAEGIALISDKGVEAPGSPPGPTPKGTHTERKLACEQQAHHLPPVPVRNRHRIEPRDKGNHSTSGSVILDQAAPGKIAVLEKVHLETRRQNCLHKIHRSHLRKTSPG